MIIKHVKRFRMKVLQEQFPLRNEIEHTVTAFDKDLKNEVKFMPLFVLLCNCHPLYRADYARKLYDMGKISHNEVNEFIKIRNKKDDE